MKKYFVDVFKGLVLAVLIGWVVFVITEFYRHNPAYLGCETSLAVCIPTKGWATVLKSILANPRAYYFYSIVVAYVAWVLWRGRKKIEFRVRPLWFVVWAVVFSLISLNLLFVFVPSGTNIGVALFFAEGSVLGKIGLLAAGFTAILLLGVSVGGYILKRCSFFHGEISLLERFLYSLAAGWSAIIALMLLLLAFGLFQIIPVGVVLFACLILCRAECMYWLRTVVHHRSALSFRPVSLSAVALLAIHAIVGYSLLEGIIPFAMDGGDAMNTATLVVSGGHFIAGVSPYPFEILMSIEQLFFGSMVAAGLAWFLWWLAGCALFALARKMLTVAQSALFIAAFVSIPFVYMHAALITTDFAALFFALVGMLALLRWRERGGKKWLYFAALLTGLAVTMSYLFIFFALILLALLLFTLLRSRAGVREYSGTLLVVVILIAIPFVPWAVKNVVEANGNFSMNTLMVGDNNGPSLGACDSGENN